MSSQEGFDLFARQQRCWVHELATPLPPLTPPASPGSIGLDGYDWEYFQPLREGVDYRFDGEVVEVERLQTQKGRTYDRFVFSIELRDEKGELAARVTNHWRLMRGR